MLHMYQQILLNFLEKDTKDDVYMQIADEVFENSVGRQTAKILTLGIIYGLSTNNLSEKLKIENLTAQRLSKKLKEYFKIADITKLLVSSARDGKINNMYGRELNVSGDPGYVLVNRFVQSSAADAALLAFAELFKQLQGVSRKILPIFLIHDAIIFDVPPEHLKTITEACYNGLNMPNLGVTFPVEIEMIE